MMSDSPLKILLVEDNPGDARLLRELVAEVSVAPVDWSHAERLGEALRRAAQEQFDAMLLDLSLPDSHGFETFTKARAELPELPIVVLTGLDDEGLALRTVQEGGQDYLVKGHVTGRELVRTLRYAVERSRVVGELREKTEQLRLSVREAHHRIKNNLQAISDLLYLEMGAGASAPEEALRDSIERIRAIATVHDLLTQEEDVRVVDARAVLERLIPGVLRANGVSPERVRVNLEAAPAPLSAKRATSLALIANELVSNAAKHAFAHGRAGQLAIALQPESEELVLRVRDDGPGLPPGFDLRRDANVGLGVVRTLVERDLNGSYSLRNHDGLLAEVRFVW